MKKITIGIISLLFLLPFSVTAYECNDAQILRYEQLASQIQTSFEYTETEDGLTFDILFHNVNKDFELVDYYTYDYLVIFKNDKSGIIVVPNYLPGKTYKFSILNNGNLCDTEILREITVVTPNYNKYYKDPVCSGVSNFELCQKWANVGNISYNNFVKSVNEYKSNNEVEEDEIIVEIEDNFVNDLRSFFAKYYIYIIIGLLIIVSLIMYLTNKKKHKW